MADWVLRCCDSGWLRLYSMALEVRLYIDAIIPPSKLCLGRSHSLSLENACVCVGACLSHKHLYTTHARKCLPLPLLLPLSLSLSLPYPSAHTLKHQHKHTRGSESESSEWVGLSVATITSRRLFEQSENCSRSKKLRWNLFFSFLTKRILDLFVEWCDSHQGTD